VLANNPVLAFKDVKVNDFGDRSLSASFQTQIYLNPDRKEAHFVRTWFDQNGKNQPEVSISKSTSMRDDGPRKLLSAIKEEKLGMKEKVDAIVFDFIPPCS
jgi:replication factor A1